MVTTPFQTHNNVGFDESCGAGGWVVTSRGLQRAQPEATSGLTVRVIQYT